MNNQRLTLGPAMRALLTVLLLSSATLLAQQTSPTPPPSLPKIGTASIIGKIDNVAIEAKVQSPSNQPTPLQIVCLFEYTEGAIFNPPALPAAANGMVHVAEAFHGLITELRKSGRFAGHALETLLITSPAGSVPAHKLLLIGLGNRNDFTPDLMTKVGRVGMREALRLKVASYSHASDLKDAGVDSPTGLVAQNVIKGAFQAYEAELFLKTKHLTDFKPLTRITLLSGPPFYDISRQAIKQVIQTFPN